VSQGRKGRKRDSGRENRFLKAQKPGRGTFENITVVPVPLKKVVLGAELKASCLVAKFSTT
jgi:hypothetical protein